ncbi:MAG TPA: hypothetical protein VG276_01475 [Actinomycetes bacterium]|nr:hypothetical protein [Actinomycetes bacterium]
MSTRHRTIGRRSLARLGLALPLAAVLLAVLAGPAAAHGVGVGLRPTNYLTTVTAITPALPALDVRILEAGDKIELTNRTGQEVVVLGYNSEPYLRIGPAGVYRNERSPTTYQNRFSTPPKASQIPPDLSPSATPEWRRIGPGPTAVWHDHRSHREGLETPPEVRQAPGRRHVVVPNWQIPVRQGSRTFIISGTITWVPGPSPWPWVLGAVLLCAGVILASHTRRWREALVAATSAAVVADVLHTAGSWIASTASSAVKTYGMSVSAAAWVVGALAVVRLLRGRDEAARPYLLLAGVFLLLAGGVLDLPTLGRSQLPSALGPTATRAVVTVVLGLGAGIVFVALRGLPEPPRRRAGSGRPHPGAARRPPQRPPQRR